VPELGFGIFGTAASAAVAIAVYLFAPKDLSKVRGILAALLFLILLSGILLLASYAVVDGGQIGVVVAQGRAVRIAHPGPHWLVPYWEKLVLFPTREWTFITMTNPIEQGSEDYRTWPLSVTTRDGVAAKVKFSVIGSLDPARAMDVYENYGTLENAIVQGVKSPSLVIIRKRTQDYNAIDLIVSIDALEEVVVSELLPHMEEAGLVLTLFGFRRSDLGEYGDKLNAEKLAEQRAIVAQKEVAEAEAQAQKDVAKAEGQKQVTILNAQAQAEGALAQQKADADAALYRAQQDAEAAKIAADARAYQILTEARAKAEGNALIAKSLTPEFITYTQWQQWDGRLPSTVMGGATGEPVVTLPLPPD
jgi:regulator of protease activity HflC (stomatin/prohibitin superfamily)